MVLGFERDQDVGVARADRGRGAVGQVDAAVGHADVVDDGWRSRAPESPGGSWPRPGRTARAVSSMRVPVRRAQMQLDLAGVDASGRNPGRARAGSDRTGRPAARSPPWRRGTAVRSARRRASARSSRLVVAARARARSRARSRAAAARTGRAARRAACGSCALQPVLRQRRHQRARQHVGGQHREHHRLGQRHEQVARDARQHEHRHEHDADARASRPAPAARSGARRRGSPPRPPRPARGAS